MTDTELFIGGTTDAPVHLRLDRANRHGVIVSYDLNYRPSLWKTIGGLKKAQEVNLEMVLTS